ncbi:MAG: hypothetical protein KAR39_13155 [Thermoplasmata archaeon]|nr:hypothetical protein [Thermoplasmata archaeon]
MQLTTALMISMAVNIIGFLIAFVYYIKTASVAVPYLKCQLLGGTIMLIKRVTGNIVFKRSANKGTVLEAGDFGTFIPNSNATGQLAGVNATIAYELMAVPPSIEATIAAQKLRDAHVIPEMTLNATANKAKEEGTLNSLDVSALYEYTSAVNPHYVTARIERRVAEMLRHVRNSLPQLMGYAIVLVIILIGGALAYTIAAPSTGAAPTAALQSIGM